MKNEACKTCKYFYNHYAVCGCYGITQIDCGHCWNKNANMKKAECPYYEKVEKPEPKQISMYRKLTRLEKSVNYIKEALSEIKKEVKSASKKN